MRALVGGALIALALCPGCTREVSPEGSPRPAEEARAEDLLRARLERLGERLGGSQ